MDDLHETSGDVVVADFPFLARHDLAELPDALHPNARRRRNAACISLADPGSVRRGGRADARPTPSPARNASLRATSEHVWPQLEIPARCGIHTSIPPKRAVPLFSMKTGTAPPFFSDVDRRASALALPFAGPSTCDGRKAFYRIPSFRALLRQASLHDEAVQDSWTALYFLHPPAGASCGLDHRRQSQTGRAYPNPPAFDFQTAFGEEADGERQEDVFLLEDSRRQRLLRVVFHNGHGLLEDDRAAVHGGVDEVDRA